MFSSFGVRLFLFLSVIESQKQTTLSVVRNGVKRPDKKLSKKLEKRFRQLGAIDSATDSIVVRWESAVAEQVKYTFAISSTNQVLETSVQGAGRSGFVPKKKSCIGLEMRCPDARNNIDTPVVDVFLWMTFSTKGGEVLSTALLVLKRECGAGQCERPPELPNGEVIHGETLKCRPGQLIYRCKPGYRAVGCRDASCSNGEWSCAEPQCARDWAYLWMIRQPSNVPGQPCFLEEGCRPFDLLDSTAEEVCFNVTVPRTLTSITQVLCNSDYVVKASLHRYERHQTGEIRRRGQIRIIDWEGLMLNRTLPFDASPPFVRLSDSLRQCTDLQEQLVDGDGIFLVAGMRSRRRRYRMRIIVGRRNQGSLWPAHGLVILYDELERYIQNSSNQLFRNTFGRGRAFSLREFLAHVECRNLFDRGNTGTVD